MDNRTLDGGILKPLRELTDAKEVVRINDLKLNINDHIKKVLWGRYTLMALTVGYLVMGVVTQRIGDESIEPFYIWIEVAVMVCLMALCTVATFRYIAAGLITGLVLYVLYQVLTEMFLPGTLLQGALRKVAVLTLLGQAIYSNYELQKEIARLTKYPVPPEQLDQARRLEKVARTPHPKKVV